MRRCPRCRASFSEESLACPACHLQAVSKSAIRSTPPTVAGPRARRGAAAAPADFALDPDNIVTLPPEAHESPSTATPVDPLIGTRPLGQYLIQHKLGAGAFGAVYLAEQIGIGRKAVIKVLHGDVADAAGMARRFEREAKSLAALKHPHIVQIYNFGQLRTGPLFLAMEYGGDTTLADELKRSGPFPPERALRIMEQICDALAAAHEGGIIHRDLKPANILLSQKNDRDWVMVVDLGIAKVREEEAERESAKLTHQGGVIGTPAYMSPEQAQGLPLTAQSDLYSAGVVLYEMLTGQLPYLAKTTSELLRAHIAQEPRPMKEAGTRVPKEVERFVRQSLTKSLTQRSQSAQAMAAECARLLPRLSSGPLGKLPVRVGLGAAGLLVLVLAAGAAAGWFSSASPSKALHHKPGAASAKVDAAPGAPAEPSAAPTVPAEAQAPDTPAPAAEPANPAAPARPAPSRPAPHASGFSKDDPSFAAIALANQMQQAGTLEEAKSVYEKVLASGPSKDARAQAWRGLALVADKLGDDANALKYYELYGPFCAAAERAQWKARTKELRQGLGYEDGK